MFAEPHTNTSAHYKELVRDLNAIRDAVATSARAASADKLLYRAKLLQAKHLMEMVSFVHGSWTDAFRIVERNCSAVEEPKSDAVEAVYRERLANHLEKMVETAWVSFNGRVGEIAVRSKKKNGFEGDVAVLSAAMIHESVAGYCDVYVAKLRENSTTIAPENGESACVRAV